MNNRHIVIDSELHTALSAECDNIGMSRGGLLRIAFNQWVRGGKKITSEDMQRKGAKK
jgi:hypothetical protein